MHVFLTSHLPFALETIDRQSLFRKHGLHFTTSLLLMSQLLSDVHPRQAWECLPSPQAL